MPSTLATLIGCGAVAIIFTWFYWVACSASSFSEHGFVSKFRCKFCGQQPVYLSSA